MATDACTEHMPAVLQACSKTSNHTTPAAPLYTKDAPYHFNNTKHSAELVSNLRLQRDEGRFLDCTVTVGSVEIRAHKALLAAFSPYFDGLLRFELTQQVQPPHSQLRLYEISDENVDSKSMERLIDYAYSGEIIITHENVRKLLRAADFLGIRSVSTACCDYIKETVDEKGVLDDLHFAMKLNNADLITHARHFIARRFSDIANSETFFLIEPELLVDILKDDEVVVTQKYIHESSVTQFFVMADVQEEMLVNHILRYEEKTQSGALAQLLKEGVRLCLISVPALTALKKERLIAGSGRCLSLLDKAIALKQREAGAHDVSSDQSVDGKEHGLTEGMCWNSPRALSGLGWEITDKFAKMNISDYENTPTPNEPFDDVTPGAHRSVQYVTGMKLYTRRWDGRAVIGGMLVKYSSGLQFLHGSDDYGYEVGEFDLDPDERIIKVTVRAAWMIDELTFYTNKHNTHGPYGGQGGQICVLTAPRPRSGYLSHVCGQVEVTDEYPAVRHLRFVWAYNEHDCLKACTEGLEDDMALELMQ